MCTINFTANFVEHANILKRQSSDSYCSQKVSIVELNKTDENDLKALYKASTYWTLDGAKYALDIFHEAVKGYEYDDVKKEHYYALTEQNSNYDNLDYKKILGLMLFSESKSKEDEINWFQVKPNTNFVNSNEREFRHVGKSMLDMLKNRFYHKTIYVKSSEPAIDFYKSQGFEDRALKSPCFLYLDV